MLKKGLATSVAGAALLHASIAYAQTTPPPVATPGAAAPGADAPVADAPTADVEADVADIVVTAQFRRQRLQDVPIAVTAVSGESLRTSNVRTLEDLTATVPSFTVAANSNYGAAPISIRGIGGANGGGNVFADEPVAIYVDGAVVSRPRYSSLDLVDIDNVEVLRGPQGTLYGRNSTAGAILLRSAAPTSRLTGYLDGTAGSYNDFRVRSALSGPLDKDATLMARLAVGYSNYAGWGRNFDGSRIGSSENLLVRASLRFQPGSATTIDLIGEYSDQDSRPALIAISDQRNLRDEVSNPTGTNVVLPYTLRPDLDQVLKDRRFALNVETFTRTKGRNVTLKGEQDLGFATLTSITNYRDWRIRGQFDSDGNAVNPPTPAFVAGRIDNIGDNGGAQFEWQWSQEARLAKTSGKFDWVLGGIYFEEHLGFGPFSIVNRLAGPGGSGTNANFNAAQTTTSFAVFGNLTYRITDTLSLTAGGRYSEEVKQFTQTFGVTNVLTFDPPGPAVFPAGSTLAAPPPVNARAKFPDFSPRAVLTYQPNRDFLVYASFSQGFKSGGFNAFGGSASFRPEGIDAYEAGVKTQLFDRVLTLNTAGFYYKYSDLQVRTPVPSGGVGIETAAGADVKGVEVEAMIKPATGFQIGGNLTYLDARFTSGSLSSVAVNSYVAGAAPAVTPENISGNRLTRAPKWQGALTTSYAHPLGEANTLKLALAFKYQSRVFFLETRQDASTFQQGQWGEIDARLSLANTAGWELAVYGKNLTDNRHLSQVSALFALPIAAINEPRRFGVQARYAF